MHYNQMSNTKSCISATAVFLNHNQKMYCLIVIDMWSYRIRHNSVSRDKIRASLNVNMEIR